MATNARGGRDMSLCRGWLGSAPLAAFALVATSTAGPVGSSGKPSERPPGHSQPAPTGSAGRSAASGRSAAPNKPAPVIRAADLSAAEPAAAPITTGTENLLNGFM